MKKLDLKWVWFPVVVALSIAISLVLAGLLDQAAGLSLNKPTVGGISGALSAVFFVCRCNRC